MFMGSMIATLRVKGASMSVTKSERTTENDAAVVAATAAVEQVEGEIRAFVRRDISSFRRPRTETGDAAVDNISSVIERVSGASVAEIDRVIAELSRVREMLRSEGERVQREIAGYANLSQAAMTSMKIIAESVTKWKSQTPQVGAETPAPL